MTTNQTERVPDEELDQMIWKLERDGMTPKLLSLMREVRDVRRAKGEPVARELQEHRKAAATPIYQLFDMGWYDTNKQTHDNAVSAGCAGRIVYTAPPAPVVPDIDSMRLIFESIERDSDDGFNLHKYGIGYADEKTKSRWNAWLSCRAAMLQSDGTLTNEGTMQLSGNSEQLEPVSNRDELPAKCWCHTCRPVTMNDMRFVVCPECGNKRCPRANDHRNACTGSNAPGQDGSAYPAAPKEVG